MNTDNFPAEDEEVPGMPFVEAIEYERVAYINEMKEYLQNLKNMSKSEARKISHENLMRSGIIEENGDFTERYEFTRTNTQKKGK